MNLVKRSCKDSMFLVPVITVHAHLNNDFTKDAKCHVMAQFNSFLGQMHKIQFIFSFLDQMSKIQFILFTSRTFSCVHKTYY